MSPERLELMHHVAAVGSPTLNGEGRLLTPLLTWLCETRGINSETQIALELPWFGRRVDMAILTRSRRTAAYELKLGGGLGRALQQAAYNRFSFDRSYVVTGAVPRPSNLALAAEHGIGLIVVIDGQVRRLVQSPIQRPLPELRERLLATFQSAERCWGV
jgi:hypothetical protein